MVLVLDDEPLVASELRFPGWISCPDHHIVLDHEVD